MNSPKSSFYFDVATSPRLMHDVCVRKKPPRLRVKIEKKLKKKRRGKKRQKIARPLHHLPRHEENGWRRYKINVNNASLKKRRETTRRKKAVHISTVRKTSSSPSSSSKPGSTAAASEIRERMWISVERWVRVMRHGRSHETRAGGKFAAMKDFPDHGHGLNHLRQISPDRHVRHRVRLEFRLRRGRRLILFLLRFRRRLAFRRPRRFVFRHANIDAGAAFDRPDFQLLLAEDFAHLRRGNDEVEREEGCIVAEEPLLEQLLKDLSDGAALRVEGGRDGHRFLAGRLGGVARRNRLVGAHARLLVGGGGFIGGVRRSFFFFRLGGDFDDGAGITRDLSHGLALFAYEGRGRGGMRKKKNRRRGE